MTSKQRLSLRDAAVPGTTGGVYTLIPAAIGFLSVIGVFIYSAVAQRAMPSGTDAILTACVTMLGVHTVRGTLADKANADNGLPVPLAEPPPVDPLPDQIPPPEP
ncbi:hypothetical protein EHF33_20400 (plasmid) [Deinococcus psychrotolerans]|uniref:Uncharacterized protein n=1 Tax=Deinococcus psychrotolerans TaxID=2489213 RepID=A0A3G8YRV4_9DEIO|nr:hypothetical protein [Deinococcus psychrotolerans]AZI45274.1 hypothetical protein EHF33_20400 [Deinococcus psychrotolerans]